VSGKPDGAYLIAGLAPADEGAAIRLAGEPIMSIEAGDRFTIMPGAQMALDAGE
jgi:hypothetical protein